MSLDEFSRMNAGTMKIYIDGKLICIFEQSTQMPDYGYFSTAVPGD